MLFWQLLLQPCTMELVPYRWLLCDWTTMETISCHVGGCNFLTVHTMPGQHMCMLSLLRFGERCQRTCVCNCWPQGTLTVCLLCTAQQPSLLLCILMCMGPPELAIHVNLSVSVTGWGNISMRLLGVWIYSFTCCSSLRAKQCAEEVNGSDSSLWVIQVKYPHLSKVCWMLREHDTGYVGGKLQTRGQRSLRRERHVSKDREISRPASQATMGLEAIAVGTAAEAPLLGGRKRPIDISSTAFRCISFFPNAFLVFFLTFRSSLHVTIISPTSYPVNTLCFLWTMFTNCRPNPEFTWSAVSVSLQHVSVNIMLPKPPYLGWYANSLA